MKFINQTVLGFILFLELSFSLNWQYLAVATTDKVIPTQQPLWSVELKDIYNRQLLVTETTVVVSTIDPNHEDIAALSFTLHTFDTTSGTEKWVSEQPIRNLLKIEGQTVYASDLEGIVTFDLETGKITNKVKFPSFNIDFDDKAIGSSQDYFLFEQPQAEDSQEIVPDVEIVAIKDNQTQWTYQLPNDSLLGITGIKPTIVNDIVFVPLVTNSTGRDRADELRAINLTTGQLIWTYPLSQDLWSATIINDTIYVSDFGNSEMKPSGLITALDLKTGQKRWSYTITGRVKLATDTEAYIWQSQGNAGNNFVVVDQATGRLIRQFELKRKDNGEPYDLALANNLIYSPDLSIENVTLGFYGSADNHTWISAFDTQTGTQVWQTPIIQHSHVSQPVIQRDRLFITSQALNDKGQDLIQAFSLINNQ